VKEEGKQEEKKSEEVFLYPSKEWFKQWRETLHLPNIKATISHTYNKAMAYRNQLI
jgi:hypothetical protein